MASVAMELGFGNHPTVVMMMLRLLWSINQRLAGGDGADIVWPDMGPVQDVLDIAQERADRRQQDRDDSD